MNPLTPAWLHPASDQSAIIVNMVLEIRSIRWCPTQFLCVGVGEFCGHSLPLICFMGACDSMLIFELVILERLFTQWCVLRSVLNGFISLSG